MNLQPEEYSIMKKRLSIYLILSSWLYAGIASAADTTYIQSPDKTVVCKLFQQNKQLSYSISLQHQPVILPSLLKMTIDGKAVTEGISIIKTEHYAINESYTWRGAHALAKNQCNGVKIIFGHSGQESLLLEVRAYNTGIAFRLIVKEDNKDHVPDESTVFNLPSKSVVWYHDLEMHYEGIYQNNEVGALQAGAWMAPPVTSKLPSGFYAAITEAALVHYSGMALQTKSAGGLVLRLAHHQPTSYPYRLRYSQQDTMRLKQPAAIRE